MKLLSVKGRGHGNGRPRRDLSISLGVPGDFQNPKMVTTMEAIVESCNAHGSPSGHADAHGGTG